MATPATRSGERDGPGRIKARPTRKGAAVSATTDRPPIMTAVAADRALRNYLDARAVGRRLAWAREAAGVSQAELGAYVGLSQPTISNIEQGRRALRPAERACVARALGCSIATLTMPAWPAVVPGPASNENGRRGA